MGDERLSDSLRGIAIIGMSGRFPRAKSLNDYWQNLREGVECISTFSDEELRISGVDASLINNPSYVKRKAILEDIDLFDANFFGFNPGEAEVIDPQHRLFLESASVVLDNAGYTAEGFAGLIGVYAGCSLNSYLLSNLLSNPEVILRLGAYQIMIGNDKDFLSTRVSYKLNLKGPSISVQSACSTSLVAVHLACQGLLNYECDMAIAGGVSIGVPQKTGYLYQEGMILSPDGRCRAFDAKAQGMVGGEGVGVVLLKRMNDALSDGDNIRAVIMGSAVNNDGSLKAGYTAPSIDGQAEVITAAQTAAGIKAETIGYVEAHGTGTALGDPIEIAALTKAFRYTTQKKRFCAIGSVKTNIGHLDITAGVASLIKTVLALQYKLLPPSLHFETPNPLIDFENSPFYVNTSLLEWKAGECPRRAGVSSFGIGGTNAHLVVEEAPVREPSGPSRQWKLLSLSARSDDALALMNRELVEKLKSEKDINMADVAYTLHVGRRQYKHRRVAVCRNREDAIATLDSLDPKCVRTSVNESDDRPVVFMFSGQGSQYVNMMFDLYQKETKFREIVDFCSDLLKPQIGCDLCSVLYPEERGLKDADNRLIQTAIAQPALFVLEYALAMLWMEWGIFPQAMIGHSIGEYVAACVSCVFTLEEALELVAARGRLIQSLPGGAMMAVAMAEKNVCSVLNGNLSLAAVNSSELCVVSGDSEAIRALEEELAGNGVGCARLHTSHAFHSQMMEPIVSEFARQVGKIDLKPPRIKYISNVTGNWITRAEATDPEYWARHIRQTVRFSDGLSELLKEPSAIFLEIGPGRTLATFAAQHAKKSIDPVVLSCVRHPKEKVPDDEFLLTILGRLWLEGVKVDWKGFYANERRYRVALPAYPFERQRYWIEPKAAAALPVIENNQHFQKKPEISDWFYVPSWKRTSMPHRKPPEEKFCWLLFLDDHGLGRQLADRLLSAGQDVVSVIAGERYARLDQGTYAINPQAESDYEALLGELNGLKKFPEKIVHLWSFIIKDNPLNDAELFQSQEHLGFYSLLFLARYLGDLQLVDTVAIDVVSNNLYGVFGNEDLNPELSTILGPCKTIPQENPEVLCRNIDFSCNRPEEIQRQDVVDYLMYELAGSPVEKAIAYRGVHRWVQIFEPVRIEAIQDNGSAFLEKEGVYLITGGLGGIGLVFADYLARACSAKLILIGRSALPKKESWQEWLNEHDSQDKISRRIMKIQALEQFGTELMVIGADICDLEQMRDAKNQVYKRFGKINGIIHAAGVAGGTIIQRTKRETADAVLAPKVKGAKILHVLFKDEKIDFVMYCSTINSIIGGIGQTAYCAANVFLDKFASANIPVGGSRTISINWDTWQEVGMAVDTEMPIEYRRIQENNLKNGIQSKEGIEVFCRVLGSKLSQIVVSTRDLEERIQISNNSSNTRYEIPAQREADSIKSKHARPRLSSEFVPPRNEVERAIAEVWQELLSLEQIGIHDNFFELGGHSLLGTQVMSRIYQLFNVQLPLRRLFEVETVEGLAKLIDSVNDGSNGSVSDESLLSEEREIIEI